MDADVKKLLQGEIEAMGEEAGMLSDKIWAAPELKFRETQSAEILAGYLSKEGFAVTRGIAGLPTAFRAEFGSGSPVLGLLGEFDALAGLSQKQGVPRQEAAVAGGNGHGCGHNLLGVGSAVAAVALKRLMERGLCGGTVVYFGCPGEEGGSGKAFMAREGAFSSLDAALSWHPWNANLVRSTASFANIQVRFRFYGKAAHAAGAPQLGRSALDAAELMNVGANFLREHVPADTRLHYAVTDAGGSSPNVVQAYAEVVYLVRSSKKAKLRELYERVCDIARGAALMTGTRVEAETEKACSELLMNDVIGRALYDNFCLAGAYLPTEAARREAETFEIGLTEADRENALREAAEYACLEEEDEAVLALRGCGIHRGILPFAPAFGSAPGSTDVGDCSMVVPTGQVHVATAAFGTALHSWQMTGQGTSLLAHGGMLTAGKVLAMTAYDLLTDSRLLKSAKKEFCRRSGGKPYECPIPPEVSPKL